MAKSASHEQAVKVLQMLTSKHAKKNYFKKADVVLTDMGVGVDMVVDMEKWQADKLRDQVPPVIDGVPVCILMVG